MKLYKKSDAPFTDLSCVAEELSQRQIKPASPEFAASPIRITRVDTENSAHQRK